jgi:hypothetical protein
MSISISIRRGIGIAYRLAGRDVRRGRYVIYFIFMIMYLYREFTREKLYCPCSARRKREKKHAKENNVQNEN